MESLECIMTRRSIREFTDREVSKTTIEEIVRASQYAPSWKNTQIARYNVICSKDVIKDIAENATLCFAHNNSIIIGCSALVVVSFVKGICGYEKDGSFTTSKKDKWEMFDAGIAAQTFCLAAHEKGVGCVILGIYDDNKVSDIISLPADEETACLIAIGYPAISPAAPKRKDLNDVLRFK